MPNAQNLETRPELISLAAYCEEVIRPKLTALETRRQGMKRKRFIRTPIFMGIFIAAVLLIAKLTGRYGFVGGALFLGCGAMLSSLFRGFGDIQKTLKAEITADIFSHLGWAHTAEFSKSLDFHKLDQYGVFPKWDSIWYGDKIAGKIAGKAFTAFEIHLKQGSGDNEINHDLFMIKAAAAQDFLGVTYAKAKRTPLGLSLRRKKNMERVKFSSSKFERLFDVFSTDSVEAHFLFPPDYVDEITTFKHELEGEKPADLTTAMHNMIENTFWASAEMPDRLPAKLDTIAYIDNHLYITLGASDFFEFNKTQLDLKERIHVDVILAEVSLIFDVFDMFKPRIKSEANSLLPFYFERKSSITLASTQKISTFS